MGGKMKKLTWPRLVELSEAGDDTPLLYKQYNNKWHVGDVNSLQDNRQEFFLVNYPDSLGNEGAESDLELEAWELDTEPEPMALEKRPSRRNLTALLGY